MRRKPPSDWCIWHSQLAGYDLIEAETGKIRTKIDVYNEYFHDKVELELISSRFHPTFDYKKNGDGELGAVKPSEY